MAQLPVQFFEKSRLFSIIIEIYLYYHFKWNDIQTIYPFPFHSDVWGQGKEEGADQRTTIHTCLAGCRAEVEETRREGNAGIAEATTIAWAQGRES